MPKTLLRLLTFAALLLGLGLAALLWIRERLRAPAPLQLDAAILSEPEREIPGRDDFAGDAYAGHRLRRDLELRRELVPLAGGPPSTVAGGTDDQGLLGSGSRGLEIPGPRILLLGDDLLTVSAPRGEDLPSLLQAALRETGIGEGTTVLAAPCDEYGLLHYGLRAHTLVERYQPDLVVLCVHLGDDLAALADPRLPHYDQHMRLASPDAAAEVPIPLRPTWQQARAPAAPQGFARRLLTQPAWLRMVPDGLPWLDDVTTMALSVAEAHTAAARAGLLVVLIPSAFDVAPDAVVAVAADPLDELRDPALHERPHAILLRALRDRGLAYLDLRDDFAEVDAPASLYWSDGRLAPSGHRLVSRELVPRVVRRLRAFD